MISDLVRAAANEDYDAIEELEALAAADPGKLTGHLNQMLDQGLLWPPALYRAAPDDVVRRIVAEVDGGRSVSNLNQLLLILAHTRDPLAEAALRRWHGRPPPGMDHLYVGSLEYAKQGGWTLDPSGARRELCAPVAYQLSADPVPQIESGSTCLWCHSPLWTILEVDTGQPEVGEVLAHTGWDGRLRITTCFFCACFTTLYSEVAPDGGSRWSPRNTPPSYLPRSVENPPAVRLSLGARRTSPYHASAWNEGGSTFGGYPQWIQDADHPDCAGCGQPMDYIGLVCGADLGSEGAYYLHVHSPCGVAAVCYQQS